MPTVIPMPAASTSGGMTLEAARAWVRQFARNAGDSGAYDTSQIDRAIKFVCDRFCRETQALKKHASSAMIADGDPDVDFTALTRFRPEQLLGVRIDGEPEDVDLVSWETLLEDAAEDGGEGTPEQIAFADWSTARLWPTPDAAYTLHVRWWDRFVEWTIGTETPATVSLNIPADWLSEILTHGVPAALQHNEPEQLYASASWARYLDFETRMKGAGGLGVRVTQRRRDPRWHDRGSSRRRRRC